MILRFAGVFAAVLLTAGTALAAAGCPGKPGALGVARVLAVDPAGHGRIGSIQYREMLPLGDREVVLTFDDGPQAPNTARVLDALAAECVKATFFVIGNSARRAPKLLRRAYDEGHTIGTHSETHPLHMPRMPVEAATKEIAGGFASAGAALGPSRAVAPFFRFPALNRTQALENYTASQRLMVWSADIYADDWMAISPAEVAARPIERLEKAGRGVVLFHDIQGRTAAALPVFLKELKRRGFRIVHVVAADANRPKVVTAAAEWRALDKAVLMVPPHMRAQRRD